MTLMPKLSSSMEATMSKIGRVNLELQEEANELGYDTVQEAIADGWEANEIAATLTKKDELEDAHEAWLKEREDILKKLRRIRLFLLDLGWDKKFQDDLFEIEAFIRRGEV